jgi:hypothetical protein
MMQLPGGIYMQEGIAIFWSGNAIIIQGRVNYSRGAVTLTLIGA